MALAHLWRLAGALVLALVVGACQSTNIPPERLAAIKTLSVINITRNDWRWERQGVLNRNNQSLAGTDWRLGDQAGTVTSALLAKQYKLIPTGPVDANALRGRLSEVSDKVGEILARMPVRPDAVLVIRQGVAASGSTVLNAPSTMIGFGVYKTTHLFEDYISAYAIVEFELFDGRSLQSLARFSTVTPTAATPEGGTPFVWLKYPGKVDRIGAWTDRFEDQGAANRTLVRATLSDLINQSVPFTLRKKGLIR